MTNLETLYPKPAVNPPSWIIKDASGILLRAFADLMVVQTAMLAAIMMVALNLIPGAEPIRLATLRDQYFTVLLPLCILFPLVYLATGLYTRSRTYTLWSKLRRAAAGAALASLVLIAVTFFVSRKSEPPRRALVIFCAFVLTGTPGIRYAKYRLFAYELKEATPPARDVREPVLVVGGCGYIGSILVRKLLDRGYHVRILDRLVYGVSAIEELLEHPRLELMVGDCRNIQDVVRAMEGVHSVVHLAAIVGDPACDNDHKTAREINFAATRMMVEVAKGERVEKFVFASSCSVYGASDEVMDEESEVSPISLYAETKVDSEKSLLAAASSLFHPTILRFSTIFGLSPRPRFDLVVNLLAAKALQEHVVTIFNGEQWRPFLHVADAAEAIIRVLDAPPELVSRQIYNIGDDRMNFRLRDVAALILKVFPGTRVEYVENADRRNYRVSFRKVRDQLGFMCLHTLEGGVCEIREAFESGRISDYRAPLYSNAKFLQEYGSPVPTNHVAAQVMAALAVKG